MHWRLKGIAQKALGVMPGGDALHYRLQRRMGGLRDFRREFDSKVEDWSIMTHHLRDAGLPLEGARCFELGTGWYPTFPLACVLAGAGRVDTFDLNPHLKGDLIRACVEGLGDHVDAIAKAAGVDRAHVAARHSTLRDALQRIEDPRDLGMLSAGGIHYHAPADATRTALPDASVDVAFSNSVLEHVPPDALAPLYREAMRVLRPGGLMFHSVNCGDHYAYVDKGVHQLNYLRYGDRAWSLWNNAFLYQNRLRVDAFLDAAREAGFDLVLDTSNTRPERLAQLQAMPVHPRFADVPSERLCITTVDFIGRKPV
jgi:SAM-dependent methyltransferase